MSARTGLGVFEFGIVEAVEEACVSAPSGEGNGRARTVAALDLLERRMGIGARYAHPAVVDLVVPWRLHLPLLDGQGNFGSPWDDPPAAPEYTEVRLSAAGRLVLAAERGQVGPVPLGLIEGTWYRDGTVPPFDPARLVQALAAGEHDAGPPCLPTGGGIEGDVEGLLAGRRVRMVLACAIVEEPPADRRPGQVVITQVPLGTPFPELMSNVTSRLRNRNCRGPINADYLTPEQREEALAELERLGPAPVVDLRDESTDRVGTRIVLPLNRGVDATTAIAWLRDIWPVTMEVDWQLPAPMAQRLAAWDAGDGTGLAALARLL